MMESWAANPRIRIVLFALVVALFGILAVWMMTGSAGEPETPASPPTASPTVSPTVSPTTPPSDPTLEPTLEPTTEPTTTPTATPKPVNMGPAARQYLTNYYDWDYRTDVEVWLKRLASTSAAESALTPIMTEVAQQDCATSRCTLSFDPTEISDQSTSSVIVIGKFTRTDNGKPSIQEIWACGVAVSGDVITGHQCEVDSGIVGG